MPIELYLTSDSERKMLTIEYQNNLLISIPKEHNISQVKYNKFRAPSSVKNLDKRRGGDILHCAAK